VYYKIRARELLGKRPLVFNLSQAQIHQGNQDLFRRFLELAVGFGATHISVGRIPYRHGSTFMPDNHDPYPSWCNTSMGLLWTFPSGDLRSLMSAAEVEARQDCLAGQVEELRKFGLKGAVDGLEPLWLPEEVYRAHPKWRGAQCELGRIARRPYFAPSIDEPEVLELYRSAMRELSTRFPEVDRFNFMSNDSGAGISWTPNVYPGMNGPLAWRTRDPGQRIAGWLNAVQEGSADAGVETFVHLHSSGLSPEIKSSTVHALKDGQFLNWVGPKGGSWTAGSASLGAGVWGLSYPVAGLADPAAFVSGLQKVFSNPEGDDRAVEINIDATHIDRGASLLEAFLNDPGGAGKSVQGARVLQATAQNLAGDENSAETLVEGWSLVQRAVHAIQQVRQKGFGHLLPFCGVSMRWIIRPLVPQPLKLSSEDKDYYRRFLFSIGTEETDASFSSVLGKQVFRGESAMWMSRWCLEEAYQTLGQARTMLAGVAEKSSEGEPVLGLEAARIGALACLVKNAQNVIRYQYALDVAHHPQFGWNVMDYDENMLSDQRALQLRKIAREELDNTQMLIELIESQDEPVIIQAPTAEAESVFLLGPDLIGDLKHKMAIMWDGWQDYESLYPTTKVAELEPASTETAFAKECSENQF